MAPEFWVIHNDGRVRYRKNVDIFAMGLTFLSMLQAKEGRHLKPIAEGCLPAEYSQVIGNMMYLRHTRNEANLIVVKKEETDDSETKAIKRVIREATVFKAEERPTAGEILKIFKGLNGQCSGEKQESIAGPSNQTAFEKPKKQDNKPLQVKSTKRKRLRGVSVSVFRIDT